MAENLSGMSNMELLQRIREAENEALASIHRLPARREQREAERQAEKAHQAFLAAVGEHVARRESATPEALAATLACSAEEASAWLERFLQVRFSVRAAREKAQSDLRAAANAVVTNAKRAFDHALELLHRDRSAKGLPPVNLDGSSLNKEDVLIKQALETRTRYNQVRQQHAGTLHSWRIFGADPHANRDTLTRIGLEIQQAEQRLAASENAVRKKIEFYAVQAPRDIADLKRSAQAAYDRLLAQHVEYWRLSGHFPDVLMPNPPTFDSE